MTLNARWVPGAVEDMQGGYDWYEERQPGLGRAFAVEVSTPETRRCGFRSNTGATNT